LAEAQFEVAELLADELPNGWIHPFGDGDPA
jgi:hypothetical protein